MNGEQQKERQTVIARIDKAIRDLADAWEVEVDARLKGEFHLRDLLASMVDGESQYRKHAFNILEQRTAARSEATLLVLQTFLKMSWWKRWGWCLFGFQFLEWTYRQSDAVTADVAKMTAEQNSLRKAQSYTERPQ